MTRLAFFSLPRSIGAIVSETAKSVVSMTIKEKKATSITRKEGDVLPLTYARLQFRDNSGFEERLNLFWLQITN